MNLYSEANYYNIAFNFIKPARQYRLFRQFIRRFSKKKVARILDLGCGPGNLVIEFAEHGYDVIGLDNSEAMLKFLKAQARARKLKVATKKANFTNFTIHPPADFAYILMGTVGYIGTLGALKKHLQVVSANLNSGGLYLIENWTVDWQSKKFSEPQYWVAENGPVTINVAFQAKLITPKKIASKLTLLIQDGQKKLKLTSKFNSPAISLDELKSLIKQQGDFELVGVFDNQKLQKLRSPKNNNLVVLRKK